MVNNNNNDERPSWDDYFMDLTFLVASRSTCMRRKVGAILVKKRVVLSTGYNGSPKGLKHCSEIGCERMEKNIPSGQNLDVCRAVHAEQNCVAQAAANGINISGSTLFCTNFPCTTCAKILINAEVSEIIYEDDYISPLAKEILLESGIKLRHFKRGQKIE